MRYGFERSRFAEKLTRCCLRCDQMAERHIEFQVYHIRIRKPQSDDRPQQSLFLVCGVYSGNLRTLIFDLCSFDCFVKWFACRSIDVDCILNENMLSHVTSGQRIQSIIPGDETVATECPCPWSGEVVFRSRKTMLHQQLARYRMKT